MKYLLVGILGTYNYGCEAIVRGTEKIIRRYDKDAEIDYASLLPSYDTKALTDCNVNIVPHNLHRICYFHRLLRAIFRRLRLDVDRYLPVVLDDKKTFKRKPYDYVLSIGGDIYTQDSQKRGCPDFLIALANYCKTINEKYILWGASVGPFCSDPVSERKVQKHLKEIYGLTVREVATVKYLKGLGIEENMVAVTDPAFVVATDLRKQFASFVKNKHGLKIAINFSPLSAAYAQCGSDELKQKQIHFINDLLENQSTEIILVPHVCIDNKPHDDDYSYLEDILAGVSEEKKQRIGLLSKHIGFIKTKEVLISCDCCIAARMHCAINASAALVPTFFLAYSRKAVGMSESIYGSTQYVYFIEDLNQIHIESETLISMHGTLQERIPLLQQRAFDAYKVFQQNTCECHL